MQISLRAGDRLYINGGVISVDRKVTIELLNDVTFLLDSHVMQAHAADTPLKQLYFVVQTLLIDPSSMNSVRPLLTTMLASLKRTFENGEVLAGLEQAETQIEKKRCFDALKIIRGLYPLEAAILTRNARDAA